jgi:hypothetical protein
MPLSSIVKEPWKLYRITPDPGGTRWDNVRFPGGLVELAGIEPAASGLQNRRSPN